MNNSVKRNGKHIIICSLLILFTLFIYFYQKNKNNSLELEIDKNNKLLNSIIIIDPVQGDVLRKEEASYFSELYRYKTIQNLYQFSQSVKEGLLSKDLHISRYQKKEDSGDEYIEFTFSGSSFAFFNFLKSFYQDATAFKVPYITIKADRGEVYITMLIGLDILSLELKEDLSFLDNYTFDTAIEKKGNKINPSVLSKLFYYNPQPVHVNIVENLPSPQKMINKKLISKVVIGETTKYYFKDTDTGDYFTIPSVEWKLLEEDVDKLLISFNGVSYEVKL